MREQRGPHDVCAVIVSYNGQDDLMNTVNSLAHQVAHIVIVDNGSDSRTTGLLQRLASASTTVICNSTNTGVAHALNQGVAYAREHGYPWVLTMDQDSAAGEDMVGKLLDCAREVDGRGDAVSFSPLVLPKGSTENSSGTTNHVERYTVITSGNLLKTSVFARIGLFEEKLFIDSVDFEYCLRIRKHGYRILRCHKAVLNHSLGTTGHVRIMKKDLTFTVHQPFRKYYIMRNHIYITRNYLFDFPVYCLWKQVAICRLVLQILLFEEKKLDSLKYLLKGLWDGLANNYRNVLPLAEPLNRLDAAP